jgi:hypothetical protein
MIYETTVSYLISAIGHFAEIVCAELPDQQGGTTNMLQVFM